MQLPQNLSNNTYRALVLVDIEDISKNMPLDVFTQGKIKNLLWKANEDDAFQLEMHMIYGVTNRRGKI